MREWRIVFSVRGPNQLTNLQVANIAHRVAGVISREIGGNPERMNDGVDVIAVTDVTEMVEVWRRNPQGLG